ncbi:MAG: LysM peptidoglycan-binding domain-containing protein [Firmicutes bacterium]|nr:LysM peptidoglycan-binding domain-containing protein [Bacillota bacterium]
MSSDINNDFFELELEAADTLETLANAFEITQEVVVNENPGVDLAQITPGERIRLPFPVRCRGTVYIVRRGDTLASLAREFGTTEALIRRENPFLIIIGLRPGLPLCIPAPQPRPCPGFFYTIVAGDTLFSIAARFNTNVQAILRANPGLDPNRLFIGEQICIPTQQPPVCPGFVYTIVLGDTLFTLATRFNTTVQAILQANPGLDPYMLFVGQRICIPVPQPPPCQGFFYTVVAGDTLFSIAARFNTTVQAILETNPGLDPNRLFIGQQICIPAFQTVCPGVLYTVLAGDTLFSIARRNNISVDAILAANPGLDPDRLFIGQRICLPTRR